MIQCASLAEAIAWVQKWPSIDVGAESRRRLQGGGGFSKVAQVIRRA